MGLQNALYQKGVPFASEAAVEFNDEFMEAIAYFAYEASSDLAREKGRYESYEGSKWDRGLLPPDTVDLLEQERGQAVDVPRGGRMDWEPIRQKIASQGMRNSNVLAIAPTATISNIMGTSPCIEPLYKLVRRLHRAESPFGQRPQGRGTLERGRDEQAQVSRR